MAFMFHSTNNVRCKNKSAKKKLLRAELLEPRMLLSAATSLQSMLASSAANFSSTASYATHVSTVSQTLSSIRVAPATAYLYTGLKQRFTATCLDQLGNPMAVQPANYFWSATGGTITTDGLLTAPAAGGSITVRAIYAGIQGSASALIIAPPTVAKAAAASATSISGTTVQLSVLGASAIGETSLKYTWSSTTLPAGAAAPTFSKNGVNAAKNTTATFHHAGTYVLTATITDVGNHFITSSVTVVVKQTMSSIGVSPLTANLPLNAIRQFTASGLDQFGNLLASQPSFTWSANRGRIDASGIYTAPATAGAAKITAISGALKGTANLTIQNGAPAIAVAALAVVNPVIGTTAQLFVFGADDAGESTLKYNWTTTSLPSGATAPTFDSNGSNAASLTTVNFSKAGTYVFKATITDTSGLTVTSSVTVTVNQTLTSIRVSPATSPLILGASKQFTATAYDQFGNLMIIQPAITWTATQGTMNASTGFFTAPGTAGTATVQATSGLVQGTATVSFNSMGLSDAGLASLTATLFADGSLNRTDMIQILLNAGDGGIVDATEFLDLQTILTNAAAYNMPSYVKVLANDVVNGNAANARYQGVTLGNLAPGSSNLVLNTLINKWFYGSDHPAIDANVPAGQMYSYNWASGSLFNGVPTHYNEFQGLLGDCYLISAAGMIADKSAAAIQNMFLDNGDGTWTVRFYANGIADYVTVDRMLPTDATGHLVYADYYSMYNNNANTLWIPLAEKAYAQWNETGKEGRDGTNRFSAIEGGDPAVVMAQILGRSVSSYYSSNQSILVNAVQNNLAVTICTYSSNNFNNTLSFGLYGNHAYGVTGYNSASKTFTLYNPWGSCQPTSALTWAQLQSTCFVFEVADASSTTPLSTAVGSTMALQNFTTMETSVMGTPWITPSRSSEGDLAFSSRHELLSAAYQEFSGRSRSFSSEIGKGIGFATSKDTVEKSTGKANKHYTPLEVSFLAIDEIFRSGEMLN